MNEKYCIMPRSRRAFSAWRRAVSVAIAIFTPFLCIRSRNSITPGFGFAMVS